MSRVRVGDVELCYELLGAPADPVVLLVAGLGRPLVGWDDELCDLVVSEGFRVLRFDNRDSGRSTSIDASPPFDLATARRGADAVAYTLDDMADDAAGLLGALGIADAHVVGTSMGGMIAQTLALRHASRLRSLCSIMATTGAPDVGLPTPEAMAVVAKPMPTDRQGFVDNELANYRVIGSRALLIDEEWRRRRFERIFDWGIDPAGQGRQVMAIVASGDRTAALSSVALPTLVVHGEVDTLVTPSGGEATARAVPGARLLVVPDMGHEIPPATWPTVVGAIVANARRDDGAPGSAPGAARRVGSGPTAAGARP